jgi:hypothetical protein
MPIIYGPGKMSMQASFALAAGEGKARLLILGIASIGQSSRDPTVDRIDLCIRHIQANTLKIALAVE